MADKKLTPKQQLIAQAEEMGLKTTGLTIAGLKAAIAAAEKEKKPLKDSKTDEAAPAEVKAQTAADDAAGADKQEEPETGFAKAGKRSQKQVLEAEAEADRQARKAEQAESPAPARPKSKPARPRSERRAKKYKQAAKKIDGRKGYALDEALKLVVQTSTTKFDSGVDLVICLGVDPKQADQQIRDFVTLPAGRGRDIRVAVFAEEEDAKKALAAGAQVAGNEVFLQQLDKGLIDFDLLIAVPQLMVKLSKYAKLLGPKGLMPNPKSGTVSKDVVRAVKEALAGRIEYRLDENSIIHAPIGKVSFGPQKLGDNFRAIFQSIQDNRPTSFKGIYIKSIHLSTTMGPGIRATAPDIS